jgi:aromatic ring-opening dioxygenase catalytic subunit (LigB family)
LIARKGNAWEQDVASRRAPPAVPLVVDAVAAAPSKAFDDWLVQTVGMDARSRRKRLIEWACAPGARACHPREEHLMPLHVMAGAAGAEPGRASLQVEVTAVHNTCVQFG